MDPDYQQCKLLWAAVLASALDDAIKVRRHGGTRSLTVQKGYLDREKLEYGDKAGYAMPSREAVLAWMMDGLTDTVVGSFGFTCLALNLRPEKVYDQVLNQPEKIDLIMAKMCRINYAGAELSRRT